jgi:hypothetical protein
MFTNRIRRFEIAAPQRASTKASRQPAMAGVGYSAVALAWPQAQAFQHIYQLAYERAKQATEVPLFLRRMYSVWN